MKIGESNKLTEKVIMELTARHWGSGTVDVLATPALIALMEKASLQIVEPYLNQDQVTVGTQVNVKHLAATKVGQKITVTAKLKEISGKKLRFAVEAYDDNKKIGEGEHSRYIVNYHKFMDSI